MSKGSKQRPIKDKKQFNKNYDKIFRKKELEDKSQSKYTIKEIIEAMDKINEKI
jgi:hypothetical protein|tara:strand:+ start:322 stop:483 length:162 start_codon:yes stop_codon:yes gene_type:complete